MKRGKLVDQALSGMSWVPSKLGVPLVVFLSAAPAAYMLLVPPEMPLSAPAQHSGAPGESLIVADDAPAGSPIVDSGEPDAFAETFRRMTSELERAAQGYPGQVAIHLKDLSRGQEWSYHSDDLFPSASLIKVPIMVGVFQKIHKGELSLSSVLKLRRRTRMGGSGSIKWKHDGTRFTVRALLEKLIIESDNTAMSILLDEIGIGWVQSQFPRMGLVYTELYPEGLSLTSGRVRYENYTTAREMTMLFEKIYRGQVVDKFASELMLEILKGKRSRRSRLAKGLPVGWELAHKTGLLRRSCHDSAVVFTPYGDYAITVLTGRNRSYGEAKEFISRVGGITYKYYKGDLGLYAKGPANASHAAR